MNRYPIQLKKKKRGTILDKGRVNDGSSSSPFHPREPDFSKIRSYEEYLDFYVNDRDLFYLESEEVARYFVEFGFKHPEILSRKEFEIKMKSMQKERDDKNKGFISVTSWTIPPMEMSCPLMRELAKHEESTRDGFEFILIFIRGVNSKGEEVSGYIDYKARLQSEHWKWSKYFTSKVKMLPHKGDLHYFNWTRNYSKGNSSPNYILVSDVHRGLGFKNKWDGQVVYADPSLMEMDNSDRINVNSPFYEQSTLILHKMSKKV